MKATKLQSGKWRARAYDYTDKEGKKHYKSFTSDSKKDAERQATAFEDKKRFIKRAQHITLEDAIKNYIEDRRLTKSPATIYGYEKIQRVAFKDLQYIYVDRITKDMVKAAVKEEMAKGLSPKTISNRYGLLRPVLKEYAPSLELEVDLPEIIEKIPMLPEPNDVIRAVKGTNVELPALLAMWLSFSLSEMKGLKRSSIVNDEYIQVNQVMVYAGKQVEKEAGKARTRIRRHRLPPYIKKLIDELPQNQEYLVPEVGSTINNRLKKVLTNAGLPILTLHQCRHLFASISLVKLNLNSEIVKNEGGWANEKTMRRVYTHTFHSDRINADKKIDDFFSDILESKDDEYKLFLNKLNLEDTEESKRLYEMYQKID